MELTSHFAPLNGLKEVGNEPQRGIFGETNIHPFFTKINPVMGTLEAPSKTHSGPRSRLIEPL